MNMASVASKIIVDKTIIQRRELENFPRCVIPCGPIMLLASLIDLSRPMWLDRMSTLKTNVVR